MRKKTYLIAIATATALITVNCGAQDKVTSSPYDSITPAISSELPQAWPVAQPSAHPVNDRPFFDAYSWQAFIALAWPADLAHRGKPAIMLEAPEMLTFMGSNKGGISETSSETPTVFMSYRDVTMLYPPLPGTKPVDWNSEAGPLPAATNGYYSPCTSISGSPSTVPYLKDSIVTDTNQAGAPYAPLVDQNGNYARYEIKINEVEYRNIKDNQLYIKTSTPITLPAGSIEFKATWREMVEGDDLSRYYVINVPVLDSNKITLSKKPSKNQGVCQVKKMGLVGMHINSKPNQQYFASGTIPSQWIFSTFGQVDNIKPPHGSGVKASFSKGTWSDKTKQQGYDRVPDSLPVSAKFNNTKPVNIYRTTPIATTPTGTAQNLPDGVSTVGINKTYQKLVQGTVWENYQLIATQWPSKPTQAFKLGVPFPEQYVANPVIETYAQGHQGDSTLPGSTCMGCHSAAITEDFSWSMKARARSNP